MNQIANELLKKTTIRITYKEYLGSGVLLSIGNKQIIITALHVLNNEQVIDKNALCIERYENERLFSVEFSLIDYIILEGEDIALIQIDTEEEVQEIQFGVPDISNEVVVTGYPAILENSKELKWIYLSGSIKKSSSKKLFIAINDKIGSNSKLEKCHIEGFSGGGIFTVFDNKLWLNGIETNVVTNDVAYNLISGYSIKYILDQLVGQAKAFNISEDDIEQRYDSSYQLVSNDYYRKNLFLISDYKSSTSPEKITDDYRAGIDAQPDHIRQHLDVVRNEWMKKVSSYMDELPVLIIRGASGQGKTTLALRYLMDTYEENKIIVIRNIQSETNAIELIHYLKPIVDGKDYIIFYDVSPGDRFWKCFLKEAALFFKETKILVAIREEDYNENSISRNEFSYNDLHLWLTEREAREIYAEYKTKNYISFDIAWKEFGCQGPLLEFTYILNHSESLQDKIRTQIKQIEEEEEASEWFLTLGIIAIAGKYNVKIPVMKLFNMVHCKSKGKLLRRFIQELFIKCDDKDTYIECLHSVRAELILRALNEELLFDYFQALLITIQLVDNNITSMLIDYLYSYGADEEFICAISDINYIDIKTIEEVLRSLLWYSVFHYLERNNDSISEGNRILNNQYLLMALTDITGLLKTTDTSMLDIVEQYRPGSRKAITRLKESQPIRYIDYSVVKSFLFNNSEKIENLINNTRIDGTAAGYVLYWASLFGINIAINRVPRMLLEDENSLTNLMKGLSAQHCTSVFREIKDKFENKILTSAGIIVKYKRDDEINAYVVNDLERMANSGQAYNDICMHAVYVLKILEPEALRYNVQLIGVEVKGIDVPDTEKHILKDRLYEKWVTELNGIALRIEEYSHAPKDWEVVFNKVLNYRFNAIELLSELISVLDKYYKKGHASPERIKHLLEQWEDENPFNTPQCALDMYGIRDNSLIQYNSSEKCEKERGIKRNYKKGGFEETIKTYSNAINSFVNNVGVVVNDLVNRRFGTQGYRLAFYNIVTAYENCMTFQNQFKEFFSIKETQVNERQEFSVVQKTAALFRYIYYEGYSLKPNVLYSSNEELKKELKRIDKYFDVGLSKAVGIKEIIRADKNIVIRLFIDDYEDVLYGLYKSIKDLIGKSTDISIGKAYLLNCFNYIELQMTDSSGVDLYYQRIPIDRFAISDDYNRFKLYISYSAERKESNTQAQYVWAEYISSIDLLVNQVTQINQVISEVDKCYINELCRNRVNSNYRKAFEELSALLIQSISSNKQTIVQWVESVGELDFITADKKAGEEWTKEISSLNDIARKCLALLL